MVSPIQETKERIISSGISSPVLLASNDNLRNFYSIAQAGASTCETMEFFPENGRMRVILYRRRKFDRRSGKRCGYERIGSFARAASRQNAC